MIDLGIWLDKPKEWGGCWMVHPDTNEKVELKRIEFVDGTSFDCLGPDSGWPNRFVNGKRVEARR